MFDFLTVIPVIIHFIAF